MQIIGIKGIGELEIKNVTIRDLFLDPNNPRFMDVESKTRTPFSKYTNKKVQERALSNMMNYGLVELRANIEEIGFLPIDKMVFAEITEFPNQYYALEGNRRLAAIKWLLQDYEAGEAEVETDIIESLKTIEVYILKNTDNFIRSQEIIQGIRHMSGVRDWRPYQKAKIISRLIEEGKTAQEISKIFGTNSQTVMRYYRAFLAFENFKIDESYGQDWNVELFRMFDDVMRRPKLRLDWLGWDETDKEFKNTTELEYFYKWIIRDPDTKERKIPGANYIKDLEVIASNPEALEYLKNEGATLASALSLTRERRELSWSYQVDDTIKVLNTIEAEELEKLSEEDESKLRKLIDVIKKTLGRARKLKAI